MNCVHRRVRDVTVLSLTRHYDSLSWALLMSRGRRGGDPRECGWWLGWWPPGRYLPGPLSHCLLNLQVINHGVIPIFLSSTVSFPVQPFSLSPSLSLYLSLSFSLSVSLLMSLCWDRGKRVLNSTCLTVMLLQIVIGFNDWWHIWTDCHEIGQIPDLLRSDFSTCWLYLYIYWLYRKKRRSRCLFYQKD